MKYQLLPANKIIVCLNFQLTLIQTIAQEEGSVNWNFEIHSVPTNLYRNNESALHKFLEFLCVIMLAINNILEMIGIVPLT